MEIQRLTRVWASQIWESMLDRSASILQAFRSDLFHDATWINQNIEIAKPETLTFYYLVSRASTHLWLSSDLDLVSAICHEKAWRYELVRNNVGTYEVTITETEL